MAKQTSYEEKCAVMEEYYQNNSEKIKAKTVYKGYPLGTWQSNLRASDRRGQLHISDSLRERFVKLGIIAPRERKNPISTIHKYEVLLNYKKRFPNIRITHETVDENGEPAGIYREELQAMYGAGRLKLSMDQIQELKDAGVLIKSTKEIEEAAEKYHISPAQVKKIEHSFGNIEKFLQDYKAGNISLSINEMDELGIKDFNIVALSSCPISIKEKNALIRMILSAQEIDPCIPLNNKGKFINIDYLYELINRLSSKDRNIIELFYGINGKRAVPRNAIVKELHIAMETINKRIMIVKSYFKLYYPEMQTKNSLSDEQVKLSCNQIEERKSAEEQLESLNLDFEVVLSQECKTLKNKYNRGISDNTKISLCPYLSTRAINSLIKAGISTIGQARSLTLEEVVALPNCGEKTFLEITQKLDLRLRDKIEILQQLLEKIKRKKQELQLKVDGTTDKQKNERNRIDNISHVIEEYDLALSRFVTEGNVFSDDGQIQTTGDAHNKFVPVTTLNLFSQDVSSKQEEPKTPLAQKKERKRRISKEYGRLQQVLREQSDKEKMLEEILRKYGIIVFEEKEKR